MSSVELILSSTSEPQYKFIYFNHMNLAQKSTIHTKKPPHVTIQGEIMKLLCDIDADFAKLFTNFEMSNILRVVFFLLEPVKTAKRS